MYPLQRLLENKSVTDTDVNDKKSLHFPQSSVRKQKWRKNVHNTG